jgi:crotonobetainyl-CoA:carnitine CoA-transferase CaiB-like acyl-CoA transferase
MSQGVNNQPLSDIRVIDLTHGIAGPYCTKVLSDFGADVVKVEKPGTGDYARRLGPFPGDINDPEKSGIFLYLNSNKKGITLDLKSPAGVEALKDLVKSADILVESFKPGAMEKLGLGYDVLKGINPNLIMTSVSNFGQTGPYKDYLASELVFTAMGSRMGASGLPEKYPLKLGGNHIQYQAGNSAAMATLFAWYGREYQSLGGQQVDVSIFETQMGSINMRLLGLVQYQYTGDKGLRLGPVRAGYPSGPFPCADGYVSVSGGGQRFGRVANAIGRPDLLESYYSTPEGQADLDAREEFEMTIWLPWVLERTMDEIVETGQANEMLVTPILTIDQVVDNNPQLQYRNYWVELDHAAAGKLRYPGATVFKDWWQLKRPAPLLGEHNNEVLGGIATLPDKSIPVSGSDGIGSDNKFPFDGVRVISMGVIYAAPYGTMFLADMGAEVIRVETLTRLPATSRGQFARPSRESLLKAAFAPYPDREPGERPWNRFGGFNQHARNKYGITLDLTKPEGHEAIKKLVEVSDVFIENNGVGSMDRLGIPYSVLSEWNPNIIMISINGFGQTGPWNYYAGIGTQFEAAIGHATIMGYPDMDAEGSPASVASDAACGVTVALATTIALHERARTGHGSYVDISLAENFAPHLGEVFMDYIINGRVAGPLGNRDHMGNMAQGVYQCAGDEEWIAISIANINEWDKICNLIGTDKSFSDMSDLISSQDEIDSIISTWTADKDPIDLFHKLQAEGIMAGHIMHEAHAFDDPHVKDREFFVEITHPEAGTHLYPSTIFKMSKVPFVVRKPPVRVGEDNDYVFQEVLHFTEDEYQLLKDKGHIGMDYGPDVR